MNLKLLSGYVLLVICAGVVGLAAIIVLMNTGDEWMLHVMSRDVTLSRALWLLIAAAGGIVIFLDLFWLLPRTIRSLRVGAEIRKQRNQQKMLHDIAAERHAQAVSSEPGPQIKL
jgi:hypothetical protein